MNISQAKGISIVDYLNSLEIKPLKINGKNYWYLSPFRDENTPSFKVDFKANFFYDFGIGYGGTIIDFGIKYFDICVSDFLKILDRDFSFSQQKRIIINPEKISSTATCQNIESYEPVKLGNYKTKRLGNNQAITDYIHSRKIEMEIAQKFLCEIYYQVSGKHYFGVGFRNDSNGYEVRNKYFKGCIGKKDITHFQNGSSTLNIFEGIFDFLSWWQLNNSCQNNIDTIILNSLSLLHNTEESLKIYETVHYYFDNDTAGIDAGVWLQENVPKAIDHRMEYIFFKDLNEFFIGTNGKEVGWII